VTAQTVQTVQTVQTAQILLLTTGTAPAVMTPATNFTVNFDPLFFGWTRENASEGGASAAHARARAALDTVWDALADGSAADSAQTGLAPAALMPLDEYPFSPRYGWIQDCYGVSWQLMLTDPTGEPRPPIMPSYLFGGEAQNRAGEALDTWISVFAEAFGERGGRDSRDGAVTSAETDAGLATGTGTGTRVDYPEQTGPAPQGAVLFSDLQLAGTWFTAMDSGAEQPFTFTDAATLRDPLRHTVPG
jgi:predicted 3-demethylubiquinone-9 3-methyltransferase (glyoxalase superfamily)